MQPTLFSSNHLTVSQFTFRVRKLLEGDSELQDVWVEGEVSNLSRPASGHIYFTLKDKNASLKCVMWKTDAMRARPNIQEGAAVEVHGKIAVYEPQGQYQLIVNIIQPKGEGALFQEFLRLKAMLEAEGLFDSEGKRPIPALPKKIGIVTSATGAALRDMLNTIRRRLPFVQVILAPSPVQGVEAPPALVNALHSLNKQNPDVILLARGGGSIEDLWAFNDERVVRAVADSKSPVICGVGHETDFTLSDFAADLRAPTPTAAAELATQTTIDDLHEQLIFHSSRLTFLISSLLADQKAFISSLASRLKYVSPERRIQSEYQHLDELSRRAFSALTHRIQLQLANVDGISKRLQALNPEGILSRGYAIITRVEDGKVVSKVSHAHGEMKVRVSDGEFEAIVNRGLDTPPKSIRVYSTTNRKSHGALMAKTKSTQKPVEELSYEEALVELEGIVESLEGEQSPLEDSMKLFERGQSLAAHCSALLESAQLKVHKLVGESVVAFEEESE